MTTSERSAAEAAQQIADALEAASIPYAIGGALALAVAGVPRGTADVDVNVFVQSVVAVRPELDRAYVRRWIVESTRAGPRASKTMMGEDDERVRRWDGIVERFAP